MVDFALPLIEAQGFIRSILAEAQQNGEIAMWSYLMLKYGIK